MSEFASGTGQSGSLTTAYAPERSAVVRLFRLFMLPIAVGAVGLGQFLLVDFGDDRQARIAALPDWLPPLLTALGVPYPRILAQPPATAYWLLLLGMLTFALIAPWWRGEQGRRYRPLPSRVPPVTGGVRLAWGGALAASVAVAWTVASTVGLLWMWGVALALFGLTCGLTARSWPRVTYADDYKATVEPRQGWPYLVGLLAIFGLLLYLPIGDAITRVDAASAEAGLLARQWLAGEAPSFFPAQAGLPALPLLAPFAMIVAVTSDGVLALRLAGVLAALALLTSVWLIGSELFRRTPLVGAYGEPYEDDGRWLALLAVVATGVTMPLLSAAHHPFLPVGTVTGVVGLWALLRGLRLDQPTLVGAGGLLSGLALYAGLPGLWMALVALLVWLGAYLLMRAWLTGQRATRRNGETVQVQHGVGARGLGLWASGLVVAASPLFGLAFAQPDRFWALWRWSETESVEFSLTMQLQAAVLGLFQVADRSGLVPEGTPYLHGLMAVLLVFAVGALLLNLDSLVGWVLVSWLGVGLLGMSLAVPSLPDWTAYLVMLPALGLAVAYGLDRLRVLLMVTLGTWTLQATVYLALGLLLISGFFGWIDYAQHSRGAVDLASVVGQVLVEREGESPALVSGGVDMRAVAESATVRFIRGRASDDVLVVSVDEALRLSTYKRFVFAPADWYLAGQVLEAMPARTLTVLRDSRANPILYVVE